MFVGLGMSLVSKLRSGVAAFSPSTLFASGEEGAWYEPSTTTAFTATYSGGGFTDIAPAGYGDLCAILLDKSQGAGYSGGSFTGLGSELVTNGTFDSDVSGWTASSGKTIAWSSGELLMSVASAASGGAVQVLTTEVGKTYYFSCTARRSAGTNSGMLLQVRSSATWPGSFLAGGETTSATNETISFAYVATSTTTYLWLAGGTDVEGYFDNISVRELPGNHATQGTESARPILARVPETGRRNLLERTEEFDDAYWQKSNATIFANTGGTTDPLGGSTADKLAENGATNTHKIFPASQAVDPAAASAYTASCFFKKAERKYAVMQIATDTATKRYSIVVDLDDGSVTDTELVGSPIGTSHSVTSVGSGWYRVSVTATNTSGSVTADISISNSATPSVWVFGSASYAGTSGSGIYLWGAQLEAASSASAYQRVSSEYDITEAGVTSLEYLAFDGSDDGMRTANGVLNSPELTFVSGFSNIKNLSVCFGLPEDATLHTDPYFRFVFFRNSNATINMRINGVTGSGTVAVLSDVFVATVANKLGSPRINGASVAYTHSTSDLTFPNSVPLLLGQNAAGNENADMAFFGFVGVNRTLTAQEISDTESYVAAKSGVPTELLPDTIYDRTFSAILDRSGATIERRA